MRFTEIARDWIHRHGYTLRQIGEELYVHVRRGGKIDQVEETREQWRSQHDYHYDFRLVVDNRRLYIETVLLDERPDDPRIFVVNVHDA